MELFAAQPVPQNLLTITNRGENNGAISGDSNTELFPDRR